MTDASDLEKKVREWLDEQGYPLEFKSASVCQRNKFQVRQGYYVREGGTESPREIDVLASRTLDKKDYLVRIYHVIECKWSQDKPWIVFTSPNARILESACVAQTMGNSFGTAAIWTIAGDEKLHQLDFFSSPARPGFSGRQAFSKGNDHFYSALKSVTSLSSLLMEQYDRRERTKGKLPEIAALAFPVVVVDGELYEAFFDDQVGDVQVKSAKRVRCHWRGAPSWKFHASIDIVSFDYLDTFMKVRSREIDQLFERLEGATAQIAHCFDQRSLAELKLAPGPRGIVGLPPLLRELIEVSRI